MAMPKAGICLLPILPALPAYLDNLIAAGKAKPMIVVMPNTRGCATAFPSPIGSDDKCSQEYVKDIIPYIDGHYRPKIILFREQRWKALEQLFGEHEKS